MWMGWSIFIVGHRQVRYLLLYAILSREIKGLEGSRV